MFAQINEIEIPYGTFTHTWPTGLLQGWRNLFRPVYVYIMSTYLAYWALAGLAKPFTPQRTGPRSLLPLLLFDGKRLHGKGMLIPKTNFAD